MGDDLCSYADLCSHLLGENFHALKLGLATTYNYIVSYRTLHIHFDVALPPAFLYRAAEICGGKVERLALLLPEGKGDTKQVNWRKFWDFLGNVHEAKFEIGEHLVMPTSIPSTRRSIELLKNCELRPMLGPFIKDVVPPTVSSLTVHMPNLCVPPLSSPLASSRHRTPAQVYILSYWLETLWRRGPHAYGFTLTKAINVV